MEMRLNTYTKALQKETSQELSKLAEHVEVKEAQVRGLYFESFLCLETYLMSLSPKKILLSKWVNTGEIGIMLIFF